MQFSDLRLIEPLLRAVKAEGYSVASPIQAEAIPHILESRDLLGCAQTGTGKTAAFALPILQRLSSNPRKPGSPGKVRCLVLCPTRELATQIAESFQTYGKNLAMTSTVVFGGVGENPQIAVLRRGVDILVATPGRLLDLAGRGYADLRGVEVLVLDEADRMLDMGFINDIRKIVAMLPRKRQTLLFSATMPPEVRRLTETMLHNPVSVQVAPVSSVADGIEESVYFVEKRNKPELLAHLVNHLAMHRAIVFTRTKHGADRVVRHLHTRGIRAEAIHGNKSQNARQRALANFRSSKTPVLVATDIASRGIDVDAVSHVVNYDVSHEPETYVHRIGRTARAGAKGVAICLCDREEVGNLRGIERLIRRAIPVCSEQPAYAAPVPAAAGMSGHSGARHAHSAQSHGSHGSPSHGSPSHGSRGSHSAQPSRSHDRGQDSHRRSHATVAAHPQHRTGAGVVKPSTTARPAGAGMRHPTNGGLRSRRPGNRPRFAKR